MSAPVPVVGFDLDLTLVDTGDRIATCLVAAMARVGLAVTWEDAWRTIGFPLEDSVVQLGVLAGVDLATAQVEEIAEDYRRRRDAPDAPPVAATPGAAAALAAVHAAGGRVVVVSAKPLYACGPILAEAGLDASIDQVVGELFAQAKAPALVAARASAYVGDHPGDITAARAARVEGVSVATGSHTRAQLYAAGADTVLTDLREFPAWLAGHVERLRRFPLDED